MPMIPVEGAKLIDLDAPAVISSARSSKAGFPRAAASRQTSATLAAIDNEFSPFRSVRNRPHTSRIIMATTAETTAASEGADLNSDWRFE